MHVAPALVQVQTDGLEEQLVGHRRRPLGVLLPEPREAAIAPRLGRHGGADVVRTVAPLVGLVGAGNLVPRTGLPGDAQAAVELVALVRAGRARVGLVQPLGGVVLILVPEHGHLVLGGVVAGREPEPHAVTLERPAERLVDVEVVDDPVRRAQPCQAQLVGEVAALQVLVREGQERGVRKPVPTVLRHKVDPHAAGRQIGGEGVGVHGDFSRRADVRGLAADVAAGLKGHRIDAVDGDPLIDVAAAMHRHALADVLDERPADVIAAAHGVRHHPRQAKVVAGARQRVDHLGVQHPLLRRAADVHHWRFPGDRDRFLERAHPHLAIDVGNPRAAERDALALDGVESGQREGDHVGAGAKVDELVATVGVGDGRPDFFNQHGTGGFDSNPGHHGTRGVFRAAGD